MLYESMRADTMFTFSDLFNYGVTYKMYGVEQRMSPDDHYQGPREDWCHRQGETYLGRYADDIRGQTGHAAAENRSTVPSRSRSLYAWALLISRVTFDVHNGGVMNAIPYHGFENVHPTHQDAQGTQVLSLFTMFINPAT